MAPYPVTFYEFIAQSLFADLRFASIYLWQNKRIGENEPSLMRHIYKRFGTGSFYHVTVMGSLIVLVNKRAD
jgi:hypothetical protein